uniref:Interleukin 12 receptor subunit beta 2 n=1 Tax=Leptobrachium leishanense TaxID=445787 RepID=A0A8C5QE30_9ANUR
MERGFWVKWNIIKLFVLWLLMDTEADVCSQAMITASPGTVLPLGSSVSITCTITKFTSHCYRRPKGIQCPVISKNRNALKTIQVCNTSSVTVLDTNLLPNKTTYECHQCLERRTILCGIFIYAGNPPDRPEIVSCEKEAGSGNLACSWNTGNKTYIQTSFVLQICREASCTDHAAGYAVDNVYGMQKMWVPFFLRRGEEFTVTVTATNDLGTNSSLPRTFTYFQTVKPSPPQDVLIECHDATANCTVTIHDEQESMHFHLRYRPIGDRTWNEVTIQGTNVYILPVLMPAKSYEFQASCKFLVGTKKWSDWAEPVIIQTPEDVPIGKLDVWYKLQDIDSDAQHIQLFWKNMTTSQVRGVIGYYQVDLYREKHSSPAHIYTMRNLWFSKDIDSTIRVVTVSAHNSKGNSPPTYIDVIVQQVSGVLPPVTVSARGAGDSLIVTWDEPPENTMWSMDYIIEWEELGTEQQSQTNWMEVPASNRSAVIEDNIRPWVCYEICIYPLWKRRAGVPTRTTGSIKEHAPLSSPQFHYKILDSIRVLVTWKEIPPVQQRGCITKYNIYIQDKTSRLLQIVTIFNNKSTNYQYEFNNIKQNNEYLIWMTASNGGGESSEDLVRQIFIRLDGSLQNSVKITLSVIVACIVLVSCICAIPSVRRVLHFLVGYVHYWYKKTVPDPANCTWAKEYATHKDTLGFPHDKLLETFNKDESETLERKELDSENEILSMSSLLSIHSLEENWKEFSIADDEAVPRAPSELITRPEIIFQSQDQYLSLKSKEPISSSSSSGPPSDYLLNEGITVDYLPSHMLEEVEEMSEEEHFGAQFVIPTQFMVGGKLRLDNVKIHCLSFPDQNVEF